MKYYVYKTTNIKNNKIYIGVHKSENIETDNYLGSGYILLESIKCHGKENFKREILFVFDTAEEAFAKEKELVDQDFVNRRDTYNTALGGHGGKLTEINPFYGKHHTPETIAKILESRAWYKPTQETKDKTSKTLLENYSKMTYEEICIFLKVKFGPENPFYGKHHTPESIEKMLESRAWYKPSEETKKLLSEQRKGVPKSEAFKEKMREVMTGRDCPWMQEVNRNPEKIRKTAEKHTGMKRSEEACKNISESLKGKYVGDKHNNFKGYYLTPIGKFAVLEEAAEKLGLGTVTIWQRCTKLNENKILKFSILKDKNLKESDLGKTWKEIGYGFLPKDSIKDDEDISENISENNPEGIS